MFFFALCQFGASSNFWNGAPLFLNITIILALVCLIIAGVYFAVHYHISKVNKAKAQIGNSSVANQTKDFDPIDDKDPTRPMAIIRIKTDKEDGIGGNLKLFKELPHVTYEVVETIDNYKEIQLFSKTSKKN